MKRANLCRALLHAVAALILSCASMCTSLAQSTSPAMDRANDLFQAKHWTEAAEAYAAITQAEPNNARAWYQLGMARYWLGQFAPATEALQKNIAISKNQFVMFNLACVYARMNEKEKALDWLARAAAPDNKAIYLLDMKDTDLNSLRDDPRYKELWLSVDKRQNPCMYSAESRQFDFWIGEWDAFGPQGRKAGTSSIQRIASGCGILENWTNGVGGGAGKSINFYDPQSGKWFQYWIGADGNPQRYSGIYRDGALRYEAEPSTQNGKKILTRLTFFNLDANTVRQLSEQSDDEGKTWTVNYDLKYVRRSNPASNSAPDR